MFTYENQVTINSCHSQFQNPNLNVSFFEHSPNLSQEDVLKHNGTKWIFKDVVATHDRDQ